MMIALLALLILMSPEWAQAGGEDDPLLTNVMLNQIELRDIGANKQEAWDVQAWIGKDLSKFWIKFEGERSLGKTENAELQLLVGKALSTFWDVQVGIRHDFEPSPSRDWAVIGINGLAPYFFEIDAAVFIGESGRTAFRFDADYELLFTQRMILTPEIGINVYGQNDRDILVGSGLSDIELGLRLRYEIRREFAPYIGINWTRQFGNTADFMTAAGEDISEAQFVVGIRGWF